MIDDLTSTLALLQRAACPEEVFGTLSGTKKEQFAAAKRIYRRLAHATHQDHHGGSDRAKHAFQLLQDCYEAARQRIEDGSYGDPTTGHPAPTGNAPVLVQHGEDTYRLTSLLARGDLGDVFRCTLRSARRGKDSSPAPPRDRLFKVVRQARNNDLIENETRVLRFLRTEIEKDPAQAKLLAHLPELTRSFEVRDETDTARRANVFRWKPGFYTLEEVMQAYPRGLHPADMAWMFNRLLAALAVAHAHGVVHGAVTPAHVLVRPSDHNGMLVDWSYAVRRPAFSGAYILAVSPPYRCYYAPEVFLKRPPTPATDLYMAAMTMVRLLGGDIHTKELPPACDPRLRAFLRSCLIEAPARRPQQAWDLFDEFQDLLTSLFGKRTFRPFVMPEAA